MQHGLALLQYIHTMPFIDDKASLGNRKGWWLGLRIVLWDFGAGCRFGFYIKLKLALKGPLCRG